MNIVRKFRINQKGVIIVKLIKEKFNYAKLKGRIKEVFGTQERFADSMEMTAQTLSCKLNNITNWTQAEMFMACSLLDIALDLISEYFFCTESSEIPNT